MLDHEITQDLHHVVVLRLLILLLGSVEVLVHVAELEGLYFVGAPYVGVLDLDLSV